jgi:hypothetical protein
MNAAVIDAIGALEADSVDALEEDDYIDAIKEDADYSEDPVTLRYQSWEARDLFNQRYQMLSRQRKIISASANDSVSSTYFADLKDCSDQRKGVLLSASKIRKEVISSDDEINQVKLKFSLSHPSKCDNGDRRDGKCSPEMNLSPVGKKLEESAISGKFGLLRDSKFEKKVVYRGNVALESSLSSTLHRDVLDMNDRHHRLEELFSPDVTNLENRNDHASQTFGLLSPSKCSKINAPIFNIGDIVSENKKCIQKFGIRSASKRQKERLLPDMKDGSRQVPDKYRRSSASGRKGEDESSPAIISLNDVVGLDQQDLSLLSPSISDSRNELNRQRCRSLSDEPIPCIGKNSQIQQIAKLFSPPENISVESCSDVSDIEEDCNERFNRQRARSLIPRIDKDSQPREENSPSKNRSKRNSCPGNSSIFPVRRVSEPNLTIDTHTEMIKSKVSETSLHINLDFATEMGSARSKDTYSDSTIEGCETSTASEYSFLTAEDSYMTELAEKGYDASSIAQPLSARSRFISSCIREGLNPRASLVLRKSMSTHLNLSHLSMGNKIAMILAECLPDLPDVESIDISDNNLTDNGLECVMKAVSTISSLRELNVSSNIIDPKAAMAISSYLSSPHCPLKSFTIQNADVDDHECAQFIKSILENSTLTEIDLSANKIGSAESLNTVRPDFITGGESIATLLRSPKTKLGGDNYLS